jgi:ABC-type multidrug transport system ATPase subunit
VIRFESVTKIYRPPLGRSVRAVEDFSLDIGSGEVLGLAGPNGAGKSTLIALLLGYLHPSSGRVTIDGAAPRHYIEQRGIGYVSELVAIPPQWTLESALRRYALLTGIPDALLASRVDEAITRLGLEEHRAKKVKHLSKGNLQRLGLAQALLRDERVIIFDEPTHGLDPVWTQNFRELVQALRSPERAIFIASHNLDELERLADRVAIIDHGRLRRLVETRRAAPGSVAARYRLGLALGQEHVLAVFPGARTIDTWHFELDVADVVALNEGLAALLARGARVTELAPVHTALERHFRDAMRREES